MKIRVILFALLAAIPILAGDPWTKADTARESIAVAISVADWGQTLDLRESAISGKGPHEMNPILGSCPSRASVNAYFAASIALHVLVASLLPAKYRHAFQYVTIGWEAGFVAHSAHIGVMVKF